MGKPKKNDEEIIDVDAYMEDEAPAKQEPVKMIEDAPMDVEDIINAAMERHTKTINKTIAKLKGRVDSHDDRLTAIEEQQAKILKMLKTSDDSIAEPKSASIEVEEEDNRNIVDKTLGVIGGVLHGVVDTASFVLESTVDLVTLGRAKREY